MKISIITIVLNQYTCIRETIESVLCQDQDVEYIIIDGGSIDGTLEVIQEYKNKLSHFISEPDKGIYDAINKGLRLATGSIIGLIHCGDTLERHALNYIFEKFGEENYDIVYGDIKVQDKLADGSILNKTLVANHFNLKDKMSIFHPSTFISLDAYKKYGLYDTSYRSAADYDFLLNLYISGAKFAYINNPLATFNSGGISSSNIKLSIHENFRIRIKYFGLFHGIKYFISTSVSIFYYNKRKLIFIKIFGNSNYLKIKKKIYK